MWRLVRSAVDKVVSWLQPSYARYYESRKGSTGGTMQQTVQSLEDDDVALRRTIERLKREIALVGGGASGRGS